MTSPAPHAHAAPRAFALPELVALLALTAALVSFLAVAGHDARAASRVGDDINKLRFIGAATGSYAADNAGLAWTFSWQAGANPVGFASTDLQAAADQAVHILRTRTGRFFPRLTGWVPHVSYSHLVLVDYLDRPLPDLAFVSSGDVHRTHWASDPAAFDKGAFLPFQPPPGPNNMRTPYSASFSLPPAFWDRTTIPTNRISQGATHNTYFIPNDADLGGQPLASTAFPSQKVLVSDLGAWHMAPRPSFYAADSARMPLLFADASVRIKASADSNSGWRPTMPTSPHPTTYSYQPAAWEPPTSNGQASEILTGRFRWTRGGILGRDFGGPEINTGQH